jgi:hypothetical protein
MKERKPVFNWDVEGFRKRLETMSEREQDEAMDKLAPRQRADIYGEEMVEGLNRSALADASRT